MRFAAPVGLAAAALALPLIAWYVLRSRRPRVEVSSTYLWRQTSRSVAAAVPWQRFRGDLTFWLVLAAVLLGALALARPAVPSDLVLGDHTVVVVDTSASMRADEDGPTRLELARRRARQLADRLGPGQLVSVVEAGPRARVVLSASDDARAIRRAVDGLNPSSAAADYADAFTLASSLQRPGQSTVTYLLSDGPVAEGALRLAPRGLIVERVGEDRSNLAIARMQVVPQGGGAQAFVSVRSFDQLPSDAELTLTLDGRQVDRRRVSLPPRGATDVLIDVEAPASGRGILRASIAEVGTDGEAAEGGDALPLDDVAHAVVVRGGDTNVLIAGPGNVYLEAAFAAVDGVKVSTAAAVPGELGAVDLLVVDRLPAPVWLDAPTLLVAPTRPPRGVSVSGSMKLPAVTTVDAEAPLLADVDLAGLAIASAQRLDAPALTPTVASPQGPLVLTGRLGSTPVVYVGFDLLASNLPLQVAWPILVANVVTELAGPAAPVPLVAGSTTAAPVPANVSSILVQPPAGEALRLDPASPTLSLDQAGVWSIGYEAVSGEAPPEALIAVNPDPAEGDLARGAPAPSTATATRSGEATGGLRIFGPELLVIPLALLLADALWSRRWAQRRRRRGPGAAGPRSPRRRRIAAGTP